MGFQSVVKTLCVFITIIGLFSGTVGAVQSKAFVKNDTAPLELTVIFERVYLDGEISEEKVNETVQSMEDLWIRYEDWQFIRRENDTVVLKQYVDDISPLLKANGYFGLSGDGVLSIFNGKPDESNIIQSFFQIDLGKLESRTRNQLKKGIPINSKDQYEKVIEAFKPYTKVENQGR
ncbi:BofC C-terminal domain-containing protein [Bacillus sp. B15-48]|uniref:BofC C-terminal domain-containing protein n=1 Tax=Bacillus sp. B15-48 TaxID=1548601 RepID=UPI00193EE14F|nr:BofC C-terminal domain-containing protein [Bacillus sp. B15-48]MBM4762416.1 regulator [Bacillus sp. B15-48]